MTDDYTKAFTPVELGLSVRAAMEEPQLRLRILTYIAGRRGIAIADAPAYVERLARVLGDTQNWNLPAEVVGDHRLPWRSTATLGHLLYLVDHPDTDSPAAEGGAMNEKTTNTLDMPVRAAFADRATFDRIVRALSLVAGSNEWESLQALHAATDSAGDTGRVRDALSWVKGVEPGDVADALELMSERDAAVQRTLDREMGATALEAVDGDGRVLLDRPAGVLDAPLRRGALGSGGREPLKTDVGAVLGDPQEFERRLARARTAQKRGANPDRYLGDEGREQFRGEDKAHAEAGIDLVATLERPYKVAAARQRAAAAGQQLDRAMRQESDRRQRLRALIAEISKLQGDAASLDDREPPGDHSGAVKSLEAGDESISAGLASRIRLLEVTRPELGDEERRRLALDDMSSGGMRLAGREPERQPERPMSHNDALNARVLGRMRELGRGESDFIVTLDEVLAEERDR